MTRFSFTAIALCAMTLIVPGAVSAQQRVSSSAPLLSSAPLFSSAPLGAGEALPSPQQSNVPPEAKQAENAVQDAVKRFRIGIFGGVGLDPELIEFGAHAAFGPVFSESFEFRPGLDFGLGEVTTQFGINLDVLYLFPQSTTSGSARWRPYVGIGPNFALSHESFEAEAEEGEEGADEDGRFDFSDTSFESGLNFIAGARNQRGVFFELRATAYGVSSLRLLGGFNF